MEKTNKKNSSLKEQIKAWNIFRESFGSILPGGIGLYEFSDRLKPLYLSPGVLQLCEGFEEEFYEEAGKNTEVLLVEKDALRLRGEIQEAAETGRLMDTSLRYHRTPKKSGWVWVRGRILKRYSRRNIFIALILDVTKQKQLERELAVQNERYRLLEETSDEILFEVNLPEDVMSYSYKEVDGGVIRRRISHYSRTLRENPLVHPDHMEMFQRHLSIAASKKTEGQMEYLSKISGHGYEWHWLYYSSIEDETGNVTRIIGRIKNIHDEMLRHQKENSEWEDKMSAQGGIQRRIQESLDDADLEDAHAMALVEIDAFRKIVEQNGVACGDAVLFKTTEIIREATEGHALLGRIEDGKILLYMKNVSDGELDSVMEHIISMVESEENKVADLSLSCCIGAALREGAVDFHMFYRETEEALHIAKITRGEQYIRV